MPPPPNFFPAEEPENVIPGHAFTEVRTDVGWVGPSQTFHVIVLITPEEGWHVYWKNPGASGAPTEVELQVPDGFIVGKPIYPRPNVFASPEGQTYGYDKPSAIFIPVTAPEFLSDGRAKIVATTSWLACKKTCVIGEETKELLFSTHITAQGPINKDMQLSRWSQSLPRPITDLEDGAVVVSGNTLLLSGQTARRPIFFIGIENSIVRFEQTERAIIHENTFRLQVPVLIDAYKQGNEPAIVEGLLLLGRNETDPSYSIQLEVQPGTWAK